MIIKFCTSESNLKGHIKKFKIFILLGLFSLLLLRCNTNFPKEKAFKNQIKKGRVTNKIKIGRGNFLLIYLDAEVLDTLQFNGYGNLDNDVDSLTTISKDSNTFYINLNGLIKNKKRYSSYIKLEYW